MRCTRAPYAVLAPMAYIAFTALAIKPCSAFTEGRRMLAIVGKLLAGALGDRSSAGPRRQFNDRTDCPDRDLGPGGAGGVLQHPDRQGVRERGRLPARPPDRPQGSRPLPHLSPRRRPAD